MSDDLMAFLTARLAEQEAEAPARVLREVAAKRAILAEYAKVAKTDDGSHEPEYAYGWADALGMAVRTLAAVWSDHPDYRTDWPQHQAST